jgi:hypothetical protein
VFLEGSLELTVVVLDRLVEYHLPY